MNVYPRETVEFQGVELYDPAGVPITQNVELCVTKSDRRPVTWQAAFPLEGRIGFMVMNRTPGTWRVWARVSANPEVLVVDCGLFVVD